MPSAKDRLKALVRGCVRKGTIAPLAAIFRMKGKPLTFKHHYQFEPLFKTVLPKRLVFMAARQLGKSVQLSTQGILQGATTPYFHTLFVQPRFDQIKRLSNTIVKPLLRRNLFGDNLFNPDGEQSILQKTLYNESCLYFSYAFLDPERIRGYSDISKCVLDEAQDIQYDFIPIIGETMSAQTEWGFYQVSGTPKTIDNTLNACWLDSSQAEWVIRCGCGKHNIPNLDHDLLRMIGKETCVCASCGKPLDPNAGVYVHAFPERRSEYAGYRISQVVHPIHALYPLQWKELLLKQRSYGKVKFYNEVLAQPCDDNVKPITNMDIIAADNKLTNTLDDALRNRGLFDAVVVGLDWSGKGEDMASSTAIAVCGVRRGDDVVQCFYAERFPESLTPEQEARRVLDYCSRFKAVYLAHDYGGAGMIREAMLVQMGYPQKHIIPFSYVFAPLNQKIIHYHAPAGSARSCYNIDKTRSLMVLFQSIKSRKILLPDYQSSKDVTEDLLNITQETRETPRGASFQLMLRAPKRRDDFAHALNLAASAIWHIRGIYPKLAVSYSVSEEDLALMDPAMAGWGVGRVTT